MTLSKWLNLSERLLVPHMQIRACEAILACAIGKPPSLQPLSLSPLSLSPQGVLSGVPELAQDPWGNRPFSCKVCSHPHQTGSGPRDWPKLQCQSRGLGETLETPNWAMFPFPSSGNRP